MNKAFISMMHWENIDYSQFTLPDLFSPTENNSYKSAVQLLIDKTQDSVEWRRQITIDNQPAQQVQISVFLISFEGIPQYYLIRIENN